MTDTDIQLLLTQPDRQTQARSALRERLDAAPRTLTYKQWLSRLPPPDAASPARRVNLFSSFTIETSDPFLQIEAYVSGWRIEANYTQYGSWQNALLRASTAETAPSAVVLLLHDGELLGEDFGIPAADALARLNSLLQAFRAHSTVPLFLGVLAAPPVTHALAYGETSAQGRSAERNLFALGLVDLARALKDLHLLKLDAMSLGTADWFDPIGFLSTRSVLAHRAMPGFARSVTRHIACLFRPRRKVLVLDLDNTLWGGVVGEDGVEGLILGQDYPGSAFVAFQRMALDLRASGILLALASKNNEPDALAVFAGRGEMVLKPEHFSARRINWQDKASNIASMAQQLGLGLDSFVFADDSAIECALVRQALPQVEVVELGKDPSQFVHKVLATQAFDALRLSDEDRQRADSYSAEVSRQHLREQITDMASFLADCELKLALKPASPATLERIHQLIGKTNQFNFTLQRHSKEELQQLMKHGDRLYSAALTDRFGDYGLIGVIHLDSKGDDLLVANMALSCRALGRGVEDAMLAYARDRAASAGCQRLCVEVKRGPRNQQVLDYLDKVGMTRDSEDAEYVHFSLPSSTTSLPWPSYVTVHGHDS